ncbi:SRPBCC domain-containing protein [Mucilaginibacter myungsuensis]|uniref:SRPBCC domain-containing protein n=1 Tax=Mucilaginibacter myungsuensis TaxID=649104 RepID=A0A929PYZ8_9SPHI|nr:SRPBCC domain-containing protein [Mucilaginibacter myungsuensis]MBE9663980.1 SRPBCC domain-containing protein [Mucilaginibacter myungsuensis]MDN3601159.1 SRPBCC domain-containing protein [Mucilaginibacter myungsuensis]
MSELQDFLTETAERQIFSTRVIDFPIEAVYEAWTNPEQLPIWWGPNGFTNTFHVFDHQPGGRWSYTMHGPNGVGNYANEAYWLEIVPLKSIVWDRDSHPLFRTYVGFVDLIGKTQINWTMAFHEQREYEVIVKFAPEKNEENLDRLEQFLRQEAVE